MNKIRKRFVFLPIMLGLFGYILLNVYNDVREQTINDYNNQQFILVKQTALSMELIFDQYSDHLSYLTHINSVAKMNAEGKSLLDAFYKEHLDGLTAITRVDAAGKIIYTTPENPAVIGMDISSQEHINEIINANKPVCSDVFQAVQNYRAIAYHYPVYLNDKFVGSLALLIPFKNLTRDFLQTITDEYNSQTWIISEKGIELYCSDSSHIGLPINHESDRHAGVSEIVAKMKRGLSGRASYNWNVQTAETSNERKLHATYHPIRLANTFWSLCIAADEEDILKTIEGLRTKLIFIMILLIGIGAIYVYYFIRAHVVVREQKKREKAETALQKSESRFKELSDLLPQVVFETDIQGKLTFANQKAFEIFGYAREEFEAGLNALIMLAPEERERGAENIRRSLTNQEYDSHEYMALRKNGKTFPVLVYSNPYYADGEIAGLRGIIVDITEQKQADDAVKRSEKKFRSYINNAPDGICLFDNSGSIKETNPAFCQMTGYPSADLEHLNFKNLIPRDDLSIIDSFFESLDEDGGASCDVGFLHKDGTRGQWVLDAVSSDDEKSMVFIKDITDRKSLEEQFRQAQKMEAIGQLAGGVAHDFNNLLTVISGYSSLILGNKELCPEIQDKIEQIKKAGDRAESLTRQLLAFSRKQIAQPEVLNVNTIIKDSYKMFNRLIGEDIKIELDLAEEIPFIMADPHQLEQILINLVVNARDAIQSHTDPDNKKQIIIETTKSQDTGNNVDSLQISIKDSGIGMDRKTRDKIFDPFFTTKGLGKGTGLGLSTVYGIVKQNNADIKVQSEMGKGATFTVSWPSVIMDDGDIRDSANTEEVKSGNEMILLVEDDDAVRGFAEETLKSIGYQVVTAEDGEAALAILAKKNIKPELLLTDLIMPGLNGKELAERVEQVYPTLKVIFTSGYTDNKIMQDGFLEKGVHFVQKPYSVSTLTSKIREVLDQ